MPFDRERFTPGDFRRATAFLAHASDLDFEGMELILDEAIETQRWRSFTMANTLAAFEVVPGLRTEEGRAALRKLAAIYAALEASEDGDG